jgi:hypothetical protein
VILGCGLLQTRSNGTSPFRAVGRASESLPAIRSSFSAQ